MNAIIKKASIIILIFSILGCKKRGDITMALNDVLMDCYTDRTDDFVIFHIQLTNRKCDSAKFITNDLLSYGDTGFYLSSNRFRSSPIKFETSERFETVTVAPNDKSVISVLFTTQDLIKQLGNNGLPPHDIVKSFLLSNGYKIKYVEDSTKMNNARTYQIPKAESFKVICFDSPLPK